MTSIDVSARIAADDARRVRSATVTDPHALERGLPRPSDVLSAYLGLTKPRIIELLLVTTVPAMFLAARGVPNLVVVMSTMLGGCLAAASANVFNCVLDRDIDERMRRTRRRPLPRHAVEPLAATIFGFVLGVVATLWLGFFVNWLSALLALGCQRVLRLRLHHVAETPDVAEHRLGRHRRLFPPIDRLDGGDRFPRRGAIRPVRHRLLLDAPAHVGVGHALSRGLRRREGPDAAGGSVSAGGCVAHPGLLGDHGGGLTWRCGRSRTRAGSTPSSPPWPARSCCGSPGGY